VDAEEHKLFRLLELKDGTLVHCSLSERSRSVTVKIQSSKKLYTGQLAEIKARLRACLRMDEEMHEFYEEAERHKQYRWIPKMGAGRMLRAPTVFEDVVKMICTTNCSWSLTEAMVGNLTTKLGKHFDDGRYSFPTPESIAGVTETFMRKTIRTGYRSPYLLELAERVASGKLDIETWRTMELPTDELFNHVKSVKGMGDYAAGNILKLLGRYDYLGLDSWVRGKYYELHRKGRKVSDKTIEKHYKPFGKWKGLFFWLEMTKEWYDKKFPL
jgi:N-glycosylase/DNA lyase